MKKIAILGGTFDPIHNGHLIAGQVVYETGMFDEICIMPTGNPPHKEADLSINDHRFEMCSLVVNTAEGFTCSDFELKRTGKIYTVDTFKLLNEMYPEDEHWMIIGTDSLMNLEQWFDKDYLLVNVPFVVVNRGGYDRSICDDHMTDLSNRYGTVFQYVEMPMIDLSSTDLRDRISSGKSIRWRVPEVISDYIEQHGLYR